MIESITQAFGSLLETSPYLALGLAFVGGIFMGFSPCVMPFFPALIGYVAKNFEGSPSSGKQGLILSVFFVAGFSIMFAIIGAFVSYLGGLFSVTNHTWYYVIGTVMIIAGLSFMKIFSIRLAPSIPLTANNIRFKGGFGAFVLGILLGMIPSPCATPVVAIILTYVAAKGNSILGAVLLFAYSLGRGIPLMAAGASTGFISKTQVLQKHRDIVEVVSGALFVMLGLYFFWAA
jgi:cytochrome c-type biogenesis protein